MWSVIRFLNAKNVCVAEIHRQIVDVYTKGAITEGNVRKWCHSFTQGSTNAHDKDWSGHPLLVTNDLKEKVNENILENRQFTISELQEHFLASQSPQSDQEAEDMQD